MPVTKLTAMDADIRRRFALYRRMSRHARVSLSDDALPACQNDLRAALLACARCRNLDCCTAWLDQDRPGVPLFCQARGNFLSLADAPPERAPAAARTGARVLSPCS
ncbi:hypothetical protein DXV76_00935 [Rhodobacteraceae bacterium CCMM004]|nr:hypothetical protein DXV76_00935 [Rhodobacteraceae bacterium CCMM004]